MYIYIERDIHIKQYMFISSSSSSSGSGSGSGSGSSRNIITAYFCATCVTASLLYVSCDLRYMCSVRARCCTPTTLFHVALRYRSRSQGVREEDRRGRGPQGGAVPDRALVCSLPFQTTARFDGVARVRSVLLDHWHQRNE